MTRAAGGMRRMPPWHAVAPPEGCGGCSSSPSHPHTQLHDRRQAPPKALTRGVRGLQLLTAAERPLVADAILRVCPACRRRCRRRAAAAGPRVRAHGP